MDPSREAAAPPDTEARNDASFGERRERPARTALSMFLRELAHTPDGDAPGDGWRRVRPGDMVGRFELVREVGRGGFGLVFEARDRVLGGRVALKLLRRGARSGAASETLQREIEAGRLRHPNIVSVLDSGSCDRGPFVAFEYLAGETLAARVRRGPLPLADVVRIARAVARALSYAHAHGILHRDLKPSNVCLTSGGEAKVIDFGLARVAGRGAPAGSGTSGYMAPEQRRGDAEDERTDLYALGLLIHEMATGTTPGGDRAAAAGYRSRPRAPLPPALVRLVADLVQHNPARRPGSADEVLARLGDVERQLAIGCSRRGRRAAARSDVLALAAA